MNLLVICLDPSLVDYLVVILMELRGFERLMGFCCRTYELENNRFFLNFEIFELGSSRILI